MQSMGLLGRELLVVMATYEFKCCGITQEITVSIREQLPKPKCVVCNGDMLRIYSTTPAIFKAKGFYSTDK
jgi:predicted nucleic acid-binding Zn ribbon protein